LYKFSEGGFVRKKKNEKKTITSGKKNDGRIDSGKACTEYLKTKGKLPK